MSLARQSAIVGVALAALLAFASPAAAASRASSPPPPLVAAREVLSLTKQRLELMDEVMASKWFSRSPIQDPVQEAVVIESAVTKAGELGVAADGTRALFEVEIEAAKEVQIGWGDHWLYYGAPPGLTAPELTALRSQLSGISEALVATLPRVVGLAEVPNFGPRLTSAAERILRVPYLGRERRTEIALVLPGIRSANRPR